MYRKIRHLACTAVLLGAGAYSRAKAQDSFAVRPAEPAALPLAIDSNTASFRTDSGLRVYHSTGTPMVSTLGETTVTQEVQLSPGAHLPMWIESAWKAEDGTVYAWYHHERIGVCPGTKLTVPEIGALVSYDGGTSFTDLGIVLNSGEPDDCSAQNGYFANGHGDFSVIPDRAGQYFYFLFGAYGGDAASQGVAMARIAAADLPAPAGAVWKYYAGAWSEPGLGGRLTPMFPANAPWQAPDTDSFWGPSVHWNSYLQKYVVLMNRSCCYPGWPQEGVYLTMTPDIGDPTAWSAPVRILETGEWYPWAMGLEPGQTSAEGGKTVRLFVRNVSEWEVEFVREDERVAVPEPEANPEETGTAFAAPRRTIQKKLY